MRAIVTGAGGFIGSHLVDRLLAEGDEVFGIDDMSSGQMSNLVDARRSSTGKLKFHRLDITSTALGEFVGRTKPEVVFHLAAHTDPTASLKDPIHDAMVNVVGTLNLLQECSRSGVAKVVFTTSGAAIYGETPDALLPVAEERIHAPDACPTSPYGIGKKVVLDYFAFYRTVKGLDFTALSLANVYGPRQEPGSEVGAEGRIVAFLAHKMLSGRPSTIYGDGSQTRDLVYVDDAVSALVAARGAGGGELINIGSGTETSFNDLFHRLAALTGSRYEPIYGAARPGEIRRMALDPGKARDLLGWTAQTTLEEGLKHTVAWLKSTS